MSGLQYRYCCLTWLCVGLYPLPLCLADYQANVSRDGFVYIVLGPRIPKVVKKAEGLNFLPWGLHDGTVLIYRNMVANPYFPYAAGVVPTYDYNQPAVGQSADNFIGDFAPVGIQCSIADYLKNYGGMSVSFAK